MLIDILIRIIEPAGKFVLGAADKAKLIAIGAKAEYRDICPAKITIYKGKP